MKRSERRCELHGDEAAQSELLTETFFLLPSLVLSDNSVGSQYEVKCIRVLYVLSSGLTGSGSGSGGPQEKYF